MAATLVRKVMLKIAADDGDTEAKLGRIKEKADQLGREHPELTVRINAAAASAKMAVLRKELRGTGQEADGTGSRLRSLAGAVNTLTLGLPVGIGEMTMFQKAVMGLNLATGLGEPAVAGLTVVVGALTGGVAAAVMGLGVFGLVAKSALSRASTAAGAAQTAQTAYANAVQKASLKYQQSLDGATSAKQRQAAAIAHGNALQSAELTRTQALTAAYSGMSPPMVQLSKSVAAAKNEWQSFVSANAGVAKVVSQGIGLLPNILSMLQPFLAPTEKALSGLISGLSRAVAPAQHFSAAMRNAMRRNDIVPAQAGGLRKMLADFSAQSGPDITKIGVALGHVAMGLLGVLHAFLPMSGTMLTGLDKLTAKFSAWGQTLASHSGFQSLTQMARQDGPLLGEVLKNLAGAVKNLGASMAGLSTFSNSRTLLQLAVPLSGLLKALSGHPDLVNLGLWGVTAYGGLSKAKSGLDAVKGGLDAVKGGVAGVKNLKAGFSDAGKAADEATGKWGTFGGKLSSALSGAKGAFANLKAGFGDADQAAAESTGKWGTFGGKMKTVFSGMQSGWAKAVSGIKVAWMALSAVLMANPWVLIIAGIAALVIAFVELWKHSAAFRNFWKGLWHDIAHDFDVARHGVMTGLHAVSSTFDAARHEIANIGHQIANTFDNLRHSIMSKLNDVVSFVRSIPHRILAVLGNLGSLLYNAGRNVIGGLINGIKSMIGGIGSAIGGIASKIRGFLPFSPAKEGPLSGAGAPDIAGRKIGSMLAAGMHASTSAVTSSASRLARAAQIGTAASPALAGAGAGGYGNRTLQVQWVGGAGADQQFLTWLKKNIRFRGGDPGVLGR